MPAKASDIDRIRRSCGASMLEMLASEPLDAIDIAAVAKAAKADAALAGRLFPDQSGLIEQGLSDRDEAILLRLADDFDDDPDSGVREKILEGLIARYEDYTPIKEAIRHLNRAAVRDPALAGVLIRCLNTASRKLLNLAGVNTGGIAGLLRVKGLSGVALSCQREWFGDTSPDLAATIRVLDKRLKQAEGFARSLNLLDPGAMEGTDDEEGSPQGEAR